MYEQYLSIGQELSVIKEELQERLIQYDGNTNEMKYDPYKERYVIDMIKADLKDVERALAKLDVGAFGIDENTGEQMCIHKLKVIPTARTEQDLFVLW
ncbi:MULTISPECIES: conjugal transfer protein TraR [Bacillaceae]|uniref:conjugal transfer protein TraR n=1 Tax=Bacillaceae TaxID=186817 RepID=UPI001042C3DB|nr:MULTISPECIES: conjugal transfer protein TraR [Bacillaceae]MDT2045720.1 conjugal transfer protein TraR [Priestia flexa]TDB50545.1 conjugal transfer protein TraR [Bacillus sp. CBEL-1]USY54239.1 conjugal transfer protein TraR [Bacillus sp. 1780r2a1]